MPDADHQPITHVDVHMYTLGTGDCFVLKFRSEDDVTFTMLIDCGCYTRKFKKIRPYIKKLVQDVDNHIDALVVTHEHNDHVLGFQAGRELFTDSELTVDRIWMAWTCPEARSWRTRLCCVRWRTWRPRRFIRWSVNVTSTCGGPMTRPRSR